MKKIKLIFEVVISDENFDNSGFKDLSELIQSGQWDKDTLAQNKVESSLSSASIEEIMDAKEFGDEDIKI